MDGADCIATDDDAGNKCVYTSGCGVYTGPVAIAKVHNVPNTNDAGNNLMPGIRYSIECSTEREPTLITVTAGGNAGGVTGDNRGSAAGTLLLLARPDLALVQVVQHSRRSA